jgi:hypothetical protein
MSAKVVTEAAAASAVIASVAVAGLPKLLDKAVIKTDQDGIRGTLVSLDARIHANAVQCLMHAEKHGDTSLMRRLLIDIIDAKSGYRRQGIIAWMRTFSPMELKSDVISLSGTLNGERRPFKVEEANKTPFTELAAARERVEMRPIFRDNLTSKVERAVREYKQAVDNTKIENGKVIGPKDPTKPFYDGIHLDKMDTVFDTIEQSLNELNALPDSTKDVRTAQMAMKKAQIELDASQQTVHSTEPAEAVTETVN